MDFLKNIGLTPVESKIYLEIVKIGKTTIGPLIQRTGLHRGTVYNALNSLTKKGFISFIDYAKGRHYKISGQKIFETILKEKEFSLIKEKEKVGEFFSKLAKIREEIDVNEVEVFYGIEIFKSLFLEIYEICKKNNIEYFFLGRGGEMQDAVGEGFYRYTQKLKKQMGVKCKIILDKESIIRSYHRFVYGERRYFSSKHYSPTNLWIYGNTVLLVLFTTKPLTTIRIKNTLVAEGFKDYFETLWKLIETEQKIIETRHLINFYSFISKAQKSLDIMGICGMEDIHEGRTTILNLLKQNKPVRILLANPKSLNFKKRVKLEEQFIKDYSESRILFEWKSAIANLKDICARLKNPSSLEIRLFNKPPVYTIIITNQNRALFNKYGRKKGQYGAEKKAFLVEKNINPEFLIAQKIFEKYWKSAKPITNLSKFDMKNF